MNHQCKMHVIRYSCISQSAPRSVSNQNTWKSTLLPMYRSLRQAETMWPEVINQIFTLKWECWSDPQASSKNQKNHFFKGTVDGQTLHQKLFLLVDHGFSGWFLFLFNLFNLIHGVWQHTDKTAYRLFKMAKPNNIPQTSYHDFYGAQLDHSQVILNTFG